MRFEDASAIVPLVVLEKLAALEKLGRRSFP